MLVLSRHRDESIIIGDDIVITVVALRGDKVRLGISAPFHVRVDRTEVRDRIKEEIREAAGLKLPRDPGPGDGRGGPS